MPRTLLLALLGLLLAAAPARGDEGETIRRDGVRWYADLDAALEKAASAPRRPMRPVVWLRVLGDLDGKT